jgi:predicted outer membrane repeat protein
MNTLSKCSFFVVLFLTAVANATVIHIPQDESTIQAGIDAAVDGDTVLVQPGTYVENIEIDGKNITIGSLTLTTGDTTYVSETIIDGNSDESVITFEYAEDSTAVLNGFTITNGSAENRGGGIYCYYSKLSIINIIMNGNTAFSGGGICCYHSDLDVYNVTICENTVRSFGGGIDCRYSNMNLSRVTIYGNTTERNGGTIDCHDSNIYLSNVTIYANTGNGIDCDYSTLNLSNVKICGNTSGEYSEGGGICCDRSDLNLSDVTISENTADEGGGIYFGNKSSATFDTEHRCNIFSNHANSGNDLRSDVSPPINVIVDTFTVMIPTDYYAMPSYNFTFDILHAKTEQVDSDVYVSPNGNDTNSGQSPSQPLRTISRALQVLSADSLHPNTIHLANGVYSPSENGEHFPIRMVSYISLSGESKNSVTLDAENQDKVIYINDNRETSIKNLTITGGYSVNGSGIFCGGTTMELVNVNITKNRAAYGGGGGILCVSSTLNFENVTISENRADYYGGGIYCDGSTLIFNNENRSNIYSNHSGLGNDLYNPNRLHLPVVAVILDTFTVMNPTNYHAYPTEEFTFDILNAKIEQSDSDLYVSPEGNDANSGQSPSEPLQTISLSLSKILADSLNPRTIHLADGIYAPSTNGERFPLDMTSHVSLSGQSHGNVILDAEEQSGILYLENDQEITMKNLIITGGYIEATEVIFLYHSTLNLSNVTITENPTTRALILCYDSTLRMANTIFWDTSPKKIHTHEDTTDVYPCSITVVNSNIQGGKDAVTVDDLVSLNWLDGNIDSDPMFEYPANNNFALQENSPCIDAGTTFFVWENDTLVNRQGIPVRHPIWEPLNLHILRGSNHINHCQKNLLLTTTTPILLIL